MNDTFLVIFCHHVRFFNTIETFLVWRWQPIWALWPQTKWQKWVSRGDLWWGVWWVLHPQETWKKVRRVESQNDTQTETRNDLQRHSWGRFYRSNHLKITPAHTSLCSLKCNWNLQKYQFLIENFFYQIEIFRIPIGIFRHFYALRPNKLFIVCPNIFEGVFWDRCSFFTPTAPSRCYFLEVWKSRIFDKNKSWFLSTFFFPPHLFLSTFTPPAPAP